MQGQELASQFTSAAMVVYALRTLRSQAWFVKLVAALPIDAPTAHRLLSVLGAIIAAAGIHTAFEGNAETGWRVGFSIPPLVAMLHGVWHWAQQLALQQVLFEAVKEKPVSADTVAAIGRS